MKTLFGIHRVSVRCWRGVTSSAEAGDASQGSAKAAPGRGEPARCVRRVGRAARGGAEVRTGQNRGSKVYSLLADASCCAVHLNTCLPCNRAPYAIWTRFFGGLMRTRREQHACVFCAARRGRDKEGERRDGALCRVAGVLRPKECGPSRAQNSGRFSTQVMILGVLST